MYDWVPIAVGIFAVAAISGALRRHMATLRGERRTSKKGALFESLATIAIFTIFLLVALAIIGGIAKR